MTLDVLQKEMIVAMKNNNKLRKDTISSIISSIKKTAIDKRCKDNITEELVNEVILKEKKIVQEMINGCPNSREDLLNEYEHRLAVILDYAPKLLEDKEEIIKCIQNLLLETNVELLKSNKGQIMKIVMPAMKCKADMQVVNKVISDMLK